jgi:hypothetical protein
VGVIKIPDLPLAVSLPEDDQYVMPICVENSTYGVSKISFKEMAERVVELVLEGGEVEMVAIESGVKFREVRHGSK